jgi:hypothetical protein
VTPLVRSDTAITVETPAHGAGKVTVKVTNPDGATATAEFEYK